MDILQLHSVIIKYLLLSDKNTEDLNNGFISKEHSKCRIEFETKYILVLLYTCAIIKNAFSC